MNSKRALRERMEELRELMNKLIQDDADLRSQEILELSREIDAVINEYLGAHDTDEDTGPGSQ